MTWGTSIPLRLQTCFSGVGHSLNVDQYYKQYKHVYSLENTRQCTGGEVLAHVYKKLGYWVAPTSRHKILAGTGHSYPQ